MSATVAQPSGVMNENEAFALLRATQTLCPLRFDLDYYPQGKGIGNLPSDAQRCYFTFSEYTCKGWRALPGHIRVHNADELVEFLAWYARPNSDFTPFDVDEIREAVSKLAPLAAYAGA